MSKRKADSRPALSESQLEIMHLVWHAKEVAVSDVWNVLSKRRPVARNTILTLMNRLEKKGWLRRRTEGQTHYYSAADSRDSTLGALVKRLVEAAFGGSAEKLVLALLQGRGISDEEAQRIRKLIDEAKSRRQKP